MNWWINFKKKIRWYTDYLFPFYNLNTVLILDYYWWIHVQVLWIIFSTLDKAGLLLDGRGSNNLSPTPHPTTVGTRGGTTVAVLDHVSTQKWFAPSGRYHGATIEINIFFNANRWTVTNGHILLTNRRVL